MRLSVVIPVYNVAPYLRACLDSLLAQTYADWEAICVDDGSADESGALLDAYAARDPRLVVVHQENAGIGSARNAGLDRARGEWISFIDPDDVVHPRLLEVLAKLVDTYPDSDVVMFRLDYFHQGEKIHWRSDATVGKRIVDMSSAVPLELLESYIVTTAMRASCVGNLRFPMFQLCEDRMFMLSFFEVARRVVISDFVGYQYRLRADSASHSAPTARKFLDNVRYLCAAAKLMDQSEKSYPAAARRLIGLQLSENLAFDYHRLSAQDRLLVRDVWRRALRAVIGGIWGEMPPLVFRWMRWLKMHGVNRRFRVSKEMFA